MSGPDAIVHLAVPEYYGVYLESKPSTLESTGVIVRKRIWLPGAEWDDFTRRPLKSRPWIRELTDSALVEGPTEGPDGYRGAVLIDPVGYDYARYARRIR